MEKPEPSQQGTSTVNLVYTCPMPPDVVQNAPGTCPKCNMALEKRDAGGKKK